MTAGPAEDGSPVPIDKTLKKLGESFLQRADSAEQAAFFRAVRSNKIDQVRQMLAEGFDPNMHNAAGDTALHLCARANLTSLAALLLEKGADPCHGKRDEEGALPLEDAVNFGKTETALLLVKCGGYKPRPGKDGWTVLHRAAEKGKAALVGALVEAGADPNERTAAGATPLMVAIQSQQYAVAEKLLDYPAVVGALNNNEAAPQEKESTVFHQALARAQSSVIEKMLAKGVFVNQRDHEGVPPLERAVRQDNPALVRLLVEHGADIKNTSTGRPHLQALCFNATQYKMQEKAEIIGILIMAGADPDQAFGISGTAPLHVAASLPLNLPVLKALLQHGADPDIRDQGGETPLFKAARMKGTEETIKVLLEAGASPFIKNKEGKTALDYVQALKRKKAEALFPKKNMGPSLKPPTP